MAQMFTAGNFDTPMFIHGQMPDGVAAMQEMKSKIRYRYEAIEHGARVRITTADPTALSAIHEFLRFQIRDHHTGDSVDIAAR